MRTIFIARIKWATPRTFSSQTSRPKYPTIGLRTAKRDVFKDTATDWALAGARETPGCVTRVLVRNPNARIVVPRIAALTPVTKSAFESTNLSAYRLHHERGGNGVWRVYTTSVPGWFRRDRSPAAAACRWSFAVNTS